MNIRKNLPFEQVNANALAQYPGILATWLPGGHLQGGKEYLALNPTRADRTIKSFSINVRTGEWSDFSTGDAGGDPISLYAYLFCGGTSRAQRVEACKRLMAELGMDDGPAPRKDRPRSPKLRVVGEDEEWQSVVPPPDGAGKPDMPGFTTVHTYRGAGGTVLRYVGRAERPDGTKVFVPFTYGVLNGAKGWHRKHPNPPMCLYGLDHRAARPRARVLLQEGEQKTALVGGTLGDGWACLGWSGGAHMVDKHDYRPLAGSYVTVCGDAVDGEAAMMQAAEILHRLGCTVWTVDLSGFPKGWDLGNAALGEMRKRGELVWKSETGPWTADQIESFLKDNSRLYEPAEGDVDAYPDLELGDGGPEDPGEGGGGGGGGGPKVGPPVPLGHDRGLFYYLTARGRQVHALTGASHTKLALMTLAPMSYWEKTVHCGENGVSWDRAADDLMRQCEAVGIYKPDRIRGRGAWLDDGRAVLHLGESMIVDGIWQRHLDPGRSRYFYEAAADLGQEIADPVPPGQAVKLLRMCELLRWERPISATLAAGWIMVAPICGALKWRPAVWITGGSNSGKTTFLNEIIAPVLGRVALKVQSKTTEAGLRQTLGTDARPVMFDEAEAEAAPDKARMQGNIDLVRQSSSEGGADIVKGTQNQAGAKRYRIRSCFLFSSINVSLDHLADESRITVLDLYNPGLGEREADARRWADLMALRAQTVADPRWCAGMVARSVRLMPVILRNAETFKTAVMELLGNARVGDQLGTLLAGAYALHADQEISLEAARAYVARHDWEASTSADAPKDEERLLARLVQQRIRADLGGHTADRTVGELVAMAGNESEPNSAELADRTLKRHGLKVEGGGVWISNTHGAIAEWLKDTPWASNWGRALKRLPGAKSSNKTTVAFGTYDKTKAVWVPLAAAGGGG